MNSMQPSKFFIKRALSFTARALTQNGPDGTKPLQVRIVSSEPMPKQRKAFLEHQIQVGYAKPGQPLEMQMDVDPYLNPNELEIFLDKRKLRDVPMIFQLVAGKYVDHRLRVPAGKPRGREQRIFSNRESPVYEGVARRLGYKPYKGFQHP